jgi:hypothetical protein
MTTPDLDVSCDFCGWDLRADDPRHPVEREDWQARGQEPRNVLLCDLCFVSRAASRWVDGGALAPDHGERDMLLSLNKIRADLLDQLGTSNPQAALAHARSCYPEPLTATDRRAMLEYAAQALDFLQPPAVADPLDLLGDLRKVQ